MKLPKENDNENNIN